MKAVDPSEKGAGPSERSESSKWFVADAKHCWVISPWELAGSCFCLALGGGRKLFLETFMRWSALQSSCVFTESRQYSSSPALAQRRRANSRCTCIAKALATSHAKPPAPNLVSQTSSAIAAAAVAAAASICGFQPFCELGDPADEHPYAGAELSATPVQSADCSMSTAQRKRCGCASSLKMRGDEIW